MKKMPWLIFVCIIIFSGCGNTASVNKRTELSNLNPRQVVETYYNSIASGDYSTAKDCLSDDIIQQYVNAPDSDYKNIKKMSELKVSDAASIKLNRENFDEVQVTAEYVAEYKEMISSHSGKQLRFIYVGKKGKDSP